MRRSLRRAFLLGVVAGAIAALWRNAARRSRPSPTPASLSGAAPALVPPRPSPAVATSGSPMTPAEPRPTSTTPPAPVDGASLTPAPDVRPDGDRRWVPPVEGSCPEGYPVKAKEASGIFHVPGGLSYARTRPDRCYPTASAAEADGFRPAQR